VPINVDTRLSPGWWFARLAKDQTRRIERLDTLWDRFEGRPPLPEVDATVDVKRRRVWEAFQRKARTNYAELIVEATRERMTPVGFRTGADDDENGDRRARDIWVANELPVECADVHEMMLVMGEAYTIVGPPDTDGIPVITAEDPRQCITAHDPARPSRVRAGLKWYYDAEAGQDVAYVYLPGQVHVARREAGRSSALGKSFRLSPQAWDWDDDSPRQLPADLMPVVRFRNRRGEGEFEPHTDHLDRINHMLLQRLVIATLQAFRQRAVKGVPVKDPKTGQPIDYTDIFTSDPGALWLLPATAELWESGQVDLSPLLTGVRDDVRDLAGVTRTPLTYLAPDAANSSAEGASLQREGAVYKAEDRVTRASPSWARTMSLAFRFSGDAQRADLRAIETLWRPVERFSLAERFDALSKGKGMVPWRSLMTDVLQYAPDQVARMEAERITDELFTGIGDEPAETESAPAE
jgi:hypothetical protein